MTYIAFAGVIGVGKTTMAARLAKRLNAKLGLENTNNPYLPIFYKDKPLHSFALQIDLMKDRMKSIIADTETSKDVVHDRSIYEDSIFARMLFESGDITAMNYATYRSLFDIVRKLIPKPDVLVWLRADPKECLQRINNRDRDYESGIPVEYLEALNDGYVQYMKKCPLNIVEIDCNVRAMDKDGLKRQVDVIMDKLN